MKIKILLILAILVVNQKGNAQNALEKVVFKNQLINFGKEDAGQDADVIRLQGGRLVLKKITVPSYNKGTDVLIKLSLQSNGDRWDKSGSCFIVTDPSKISMIAISKGEKEFPPKSNVDKKHKGILATEDYKPAVELLRFMTPFGVGFYSNDDGKHRKPVYIPKWENEVVWEQDISQLASVVTSTFYIGVWIDTWTKEGYKIDLSLKYSDRPTKITKVIPLINTVNYVKGQGLPDFFANGSLDYVFEIAKNLKNAKLHYTTTGHGGHSGGDEFIKIKNSIHLDNKLVLDTIPWRDDCASFRRFSPTSGVWLKKDSTSYRDYETNTYKVKEIEERLASSDLSRSNWCPGSMVKPYSISLGDLKTGKHNMKITIPATQSEKDKANHWLVSAYITYED
ncbi:PNGase F N-terminal domain-containing protein [Flavobacterium algicola]|uniref:PNGase F N-terminal domain-containing protein n=1 Tax=Flavobacterium algicola TaxID=556529 RepID=UPI001EFEDB92|nr:PNGase F N-terminal domain-containing protein [Flavobacterium algicola]MCG9793133.1 N-glycanase [Flavobacterium algicola]